MLTTGIAVMAKTPRPGHSKTRLMPLLTPDQAASMSAAFLGDVMENLAAATQNAPITPYLAFAPAGTQSGFDNIVKPGTQMLLADGLAEMPAGVEGFGRCLLQAVQSMLARGHQSACVLNSDSPNLPTNLLVQAHSLLAAPGDRVVMGPADDGGYYLLGVKQAHAALFSNIAWSSEHVAAQTRQRAASCGLPLVELDTWYDVDEPATLTRLLRELANPATPHAFNAPRTAACARRFGLYAPSKTLAGATICP